VEDNRAVVRGSVGRGVLADGFELVGRTDGILQAKTNPFELPVFADEPSRS
jgi:hypothetical protein